MRWLFNSTPVDPRKLSMEYFNIARQHPSRREHVHGKIHEMHCKCGVCRKVAA